MHQPLRIAILECDTPLPKTHSRYNGYGGVFISLFKSSANELSQPSRLNPGIGLKFERWDIVNGDKYPSMEDIDAVVLTGSRHNAFDDTPWINRLVKFTRQVLAQDRVRIVGICFGHQIVGRAMGGKVGPNDQGWEVAVCDINLTEKGREIFGLEKLRIQQMHRDIVFSCPADVILLGSSPCCAIQGMYAPRRFITLQGHPEFNGEIETEIILSRSEAGILSQEQAQEALCRVNLEHHGQTIGAKLLEFLLEGLN